MVVRGWLIAWLLIPGLINGCSVHVSAPTGEDVAIQDGDDAISRIVTERGVWQHPVSWQVALDTSIIRGPIS